MPGAAHGGLRAGDVLPRRQREAGADGGVHRPGEGEVPLHRAAAPDAHLQGRADFGLLLRVRGAAGGPELVVVADRAADGGVRAGDLLPQRQRDAGADGGVPGAGLRAAALSGRRTRESSGRPRNFRGPRRYGARACRSAPSRPGTWVSVARPEARKARVTRSTSPRSQRKSQAMSAGVAATTVRR